MSSPDLCALNTNPDISGIGVRVSFYLQTFFLVFIVHLKRDDAPGALLTNISTSFGLTVAALVQAAYGTLSLYQALQVTHLVHLANISTFLALASYSREKKSVTPIKFAAVVQSYFSIGLTLALWAVQPTFGNQATCNEPITIILFALIPVANARIPIIVLIVLALLVYSYITLDELWQWKERYVKKREKKRQREKRAEHRRQQSSQVLLSPSNLTLPSPLQQHRSRSNPSIRDSTREPKAQRNPQPNTQQQKRPMFCQCLTSMDPLFVAITMMQVITLVYFVAATELLIEKNEAPDTEIQVWGFGQILAMVVTIPAACSFGQSLWALKAKRKKSKRSHSGSQNQPASP